MKTNYAVDTAKRYDLAYRQVWGQLPRWKQRAIQEDLNAGKPSFLLDEMMKEVTRLAEDETAAVSEGYPEVPKFTEVQPIS